MDLVKLGMRVFDIGNNDIPYAQTSLFVNGTGDYTDTITQMKKLVPMMQVLSGTNTPDGPSLTLVLGNDFQPVADTQKPLFLLY